MSSLECKCVFYRPQSNEKWVPMELNFEFLEMQKWNIPTDRAERVDKNNVSCLGIMFTPRVMVSKMSKWLIFCIFCYMTLKTWQKFKQNIYLSASQRSYLDLVESAMDYWVLSYH